MWIFFQFEFLGVQLMQNSSNQKGVLGYFSWDTFDSNEGEPREIWNIN